MTETIRRNFVCSNHAISDLKIKALEYLSKANIASDDNEREEWLAAHERTWIQINKLQKKAIVCA